MARRMAVEAESLFGETLRCALPYLFIESAQPEVHFGGERRRITHCHLVMLDRITLEQVARGLALVDCLHVGMLTQPILGDDLVDFRVKRCGIHRCTSPKV